MKRRRRLTSLKIAAAGAATALVVVGTGFTAGAATSNGANMPVPVPGDVNPAALPGAVATGATPGSTQETVSFVLTEQNLAALEFAVTHGITQYDTVGQFAQTYGQSPKVIFELQKYLAGFGITTQVYPDDVDVVAMGTAAEFDAALGVQQQQFNVPQQSESNGQTIPAQTVHGTSQPPSLPANLAKYVTAILGLSNYASFLSNTRHIDTSLASAQPGNSNSCVALTGLPNACNTPRVIRRQLRARPALQGRRHRGGPDRRHRHAGRRRPGCTPSTSGRTSWGCPTPGGPSRSRTSTVVRARRATRGAPGSPTSTSSSRAVSPPVRT